MPIVRLPAGRRFVGLLTAAVAVLTGFAAFATHAGLSEVKDRDLRRAEIKAQDLAQAASLAVANSIDKIDISLRTVAAELERFGADPAAIGEVVARQYQLVAESEDFSVTDAVGRVIFHEGATAPPDFDVSDRPYFSRSAEGAERDLVVSGPLASRLSGHRVLVFARAYANADGAFGGLVVIPVQTELFRRLISGYALAPNDRLGLWTAELSPIAEVPETPAPGGLHEIRVYAAMRATATVFRESEGGTPRIVAMRRVANTAIYAVCAIDERDALEDWRGLRVAALAGLAAFVGVTLLGVGGLYRMWARQQRHAVALAASNARLTEALRKLRTLDAALVAARDVGGLGTFSLDLNDGTWIASPAQAAIFGLGDDGALSRKDWDSLIHPEDFPRLMATIGERLRLGHEDFDLEYRIVRPNDGAVRWIHGVGRIETGEEGTILVGAVKDITDAKLSRDRAEYLAHHDSLTHLPNRTLLADRMRQALADRRDDEIAVCYLDLDGFKPINDAWGHDVGDALLVEVARRLEHAARASDTVARMGGDEFVVLLGGVTDSAELAGVAQRMLGTIGEPFRIGDIVASLSASIGIALHPRDPAAEPDALVRQADQAMYEAKREGRNRFHIYDAERDRQMQAHRAHTARMIAALANREFRLHYQPRVDLRSGAVDGVEALLRWQHPERGLLPPAAFLAGIEDTELALPLGEWVLRTALLQRRAWRAEGLDLVVAVNVFGCQLQHPGFAERLAEILAEFPDLPPAGLELEIVETTVMQDLPLAARRLEDCARLGVRFALDDFGTGYSSLTYFRSLPVSLLKIDRSFVADILENPGDQAVVQSVVAMAHAFGRTVVAEGLESPAHGRALLRYGCDLAQGFGIAKPMPAEALAPWAAAWEMPPAWREAYG